MMQDPTVGAIVRTDADTAFSEAVSIAVDDHAGRAGWLPGGAALLGAPNPTTTSTRASATCPMAMRCTRP